MPVLRSKGANGTATVTDIVDSQCRFLFVVKPIDTLHGVQPREYQPCSIQCGIERSSGGRFGESGNCFSCSG